jgi:hypothetical protein
VTCSVTQRSQRMKQNEENAIVDVQIWCEDIRRSANAILLTVF